jgi:pimeloyl-ACP methyl ester carboxylesterase
MTPKWLNAGSMARIPRYGAVHEAAKATNWVVCTRNTAGSPLPADGARVLVAHGWLGGAWQIRRLIDRLRSAGFDAAPICYPSAVATFPHAVGIAGRAAAEGAAPLHLVGFSYGGLVMRALAAEAPAGLVSLLLIGAPNLGSPLADRAQRIAPTPALRRLGTDAPQLPPLPPGLRVGCIAGSRSGFVGRLIREPNDSRVPVSSALGVAHHASRILDLRHDALPASPETAHLAVRFLTSGEF